MSLKDLFSSSSSKGTNSFIQKDLDREKYEKITNTMCEKRRAAEKTLENKEIDANTREESALTLLQLKQDMALFGITEVDYQVYLNKTPEIEQAPQLPFTS